MYLYAGWTVNDASIPLNHTLFSYFSKVLCNELLWNENMIPLKHGPKNNMRPFTLWLVGAFRTGENFARHWTEILDFFILFVCEWMWVLSWVNIEQFEKEKTLCAKLLNPLLLTDMSRERKEICCSYNISFQAQKQFRWNWDSFSREYAMKMLSALQLYGEGVFKSCVYPWTSRCRCPRFIHQENDSRIMVLSENSWAFKCQRLFFYRNSRSVLTSTCLLINVPFSFWRKYLNGCGIRIGNAAVLA